jgi:NAD(P)H-dependent FMN reductase
MNDLTIQVILGSTRKGRFSEKPGHYIIDELARREGVKAELIDLREWPLPFYDEAQSPTSLKGNFESKLGKKWNAKLAEADGYVIVSPEYNHGYPAVLKNAIDWVYGTSWEKRPVGFVSYGSTLGARAVGQLRQVAIEAQLVPIRNSIHIPSDVYRAVTSHDVPVPADVWKPLREPADRIAGFFDQLLWYAKIVKEGRAQKT